MYQLHSGMWTPYKSRSIEDMLGRAVVFLDTWELGRLANIRQTSFLYMVNPAANNTRLEHSIGAGYLAGEIGQSVGLGEEDVAHLRLAGLFHDLGHSFWSHVGEDLIKELTGKDHEAITLEKLERLRDLIEQQQFDYGQVRSILDGSHPYSPIVSGPVISADKLDYLSRDSHHTSGRQGFDIERLLIFLRFKDGKYAVDYHALEALESTAMAYLRNYIGDYLTEDAMLIGEGMLRALYNAIEEHHINPDQMLEWDDTEPMGIIRYSNNRTARRIYETFFGARDVRPFRMLTIAQIKHIDLGIPYPSLVEIVDDAEYKQLAKSVNTVSSRDRKDAQIAELFGIPSGDIVLFLVPGHKINVGDVNVLYSDGEIKSLYEASSLGNKFKETAYHDAICLAVGPDSVYGVSTAIKQKGFARLLHELSV